MFAADCSPHGQSLGVNIGSQIFQLLHVAGIRQIQERPHVQLPMADVPVKRRRHLMPLECVLQSQDKIGERPRGHSHVLDERYRARRSLKPVQRRRDAAHELPAKIPVLFIEGQMHIERQSLLAAHVLKRFRQPAANLRAIVANVLDDQQGLGLAGDQEVIANVCLARQA